MNASDGNSGTPENVKSRKRAIERDLQFIFFLLNAPIYQKQRPNLYERLREYSTQAGALEAEINHLDKGVGNNLENYERKLNTWKSGLYEFLESML
ncbi:hypothetical protein [Robiginitalea sp.]|uniref:hypothetical protein n=1 Tax=Robiginitalea sp. TaxID=1902411 RepID=UPI003C50D4E4